jgi:hypothetical protein
VQRNQEKVKLREELIKEERSTGMHKDKKSESEEGRFETIQGRIGGRIVEEEGKAVEAVEASME